MKKLIPLFVSTLFMTSWLTLPFTQELLITADKQPTAPLLTLLSLCHIEHTGSLSSIINATQKEQPVGFLRPRGTERWQLTPYWTAGTQDIYHQCVLLHMIEKIVPRKKSYDTVILHGGTLEGVRNRLAYLIHLWQSGIQWQHLIILTGQRPLNPQIESREALTDVHNGFLTIKPTWQLQKDPFFETDMIRMILEQSVLPAAWETIPITIIDTPGHYQGTTWIRPTTADTVRAWLATNPTPGIFLAISSQPFIGYQDAIVKTIVPACFTIETVGPAALADATTPEILIDTVGRWLYNAQHLF